MANTKFSKKSKATPKRKAVAIAPPVEIKGRFNNIDFSLTHSQMEDKIHDALESGKQVNDPFVRSNALHRIHLPGVEVPVSLGWALEVLIGAHATGITKEGNPRGMYTPIQAMMCLQKFEPLGIRVESRSPKPQYQKWSEVAREQIENARKAEEAAKAQAEQEARQAARSKSKRR